MKNLSLIIMMALSMVLTSCDEHEPIDLDIHPGYILCSDGQIVPRHPSRLHPLFGWSDSKSFGFQ